MRVVFFLVLSVFCQFVFSADANSANAIRADADDQRTAADSHYNCFTIPAKQELTSRTDYMSNWLTANNNWNWNLMSTYDQGLYNNRIALANGRKTLGNECLNGTQQNPNSGYWYKFNQGEDNLWIGDYCFGQEDYEGAEYAYTEAGWNYISAHNYAEDAHEWYWLSTFANSARTAILEAETILDDIWPNGWGF